MPRLLCPHYDAFRCRSCTLIERDYDDQVRGKQARCEELLGPGIAWLDPVLSAPAGFRNKAKLVVGGTAAAPTLGILDPEGAGIDLRDCLLYPPQLQAAFGPLARFITLARLEPYDVPARRGELKNLLVTVSPDGELMVRFVLRSTEALARIRKHLPTLQAELPTLAVATVNVLPEHRAVLEGAREIVLTGSDTLRMRLNGLDLHLRPQSFFQTNTEVAAALYRTGRDWVDAVDPRTVWDLYCGVGGFALHVAAPGRAVTGIELSAEAIASAEQTAAESGLPGLRFAAGDATDFALTATAPPDLVIVNPPRRGIGSRLAQWLEGSGVRHVLYSSCNAVSLASDLAAMPSLRPTTGRLLDMFPQTGHFEVAVMLRRD
ncbi:23S rRNA (uracil(747)-C(5))-methyltransferase [Cellulomonas denverensis]|nr:23S rRNA (uracil(747)-C(5))-methyltransferase [Cellulomonas denverensis]